MEQTLIDLVRELRTSTYQSTAEYALRDFGTKLTPHLQAALDLGLIEVVETRIDTTRFPGTPVRFLRAVWPIPLEDTKVVSASALYRGALIVNDHGHRVGPVVSAQADTYGSVTIGDPRGAWSKSFDADETVRIVA